MDTTHHYGYRLSANAKDTCYCSFLCLDDAHHALLHAFIRLCLLKHNCDNSMPYNGVLRLLWHGVPQVKPKLMLIPFS